MKTVLLIPFLFLLPIITSAQVTPPADLKEVFSDAEFFFAQEEYADALIDYSTLYNNGFNGNANINYRMGICYLGLAGQKEKSISYLLEAVKNTSKKYDESNIKQEAAPLDAWLFLGNAYRVNNKLQEAIAAYTKYKELVGKSEEIKYADQQILACNTAMQFMEKPLNVKFTNLGDSVNGASSNVKAVISGNGKVILYMNELPFYDAVYFSRYTPLGWSSPINITPQIQSDGDQYVTAVSYDGTRLLLTREDAFNSDLYISDLKNGVWSKSTPMQGEGINTKFWESHASLSKDGKKLYFTSNRKDGFGAMDMYVSQLASNGTWGKPVNLGSGLNTPLNEDTPFISENDSILFFSSQGHSSMGGYDIFVSRLNAEGNWSTPENIGYPLNTTDDDLFYYPWNNAKAGLVSRTLDNGYGKEDVYAVQPGEDPDFETILADHIRQYEPFEAKPEPEPEPETIAVAEVPEKEVISSPENPPDAGSEVAEAPAEKPVVAMPREIALEPVYFAFDHFELSAAGKAELEKVYILLNEFPVARARLIGHADAKGPAEYNQKLSEKRALAAKKYITDKGIDPSRIETFGMGERNFAAVNSNSDGSDNPEGRQLNRRVEYEIIGTDQNLVKIRLSPVPDKLKYRE